jgi:membrane fusion protein (multidrug efflux system)
LRAAVLQAEAEVAGARAGLAALRTSAALQPNETIVNVATADANLRALRAALAAAQAAAGQARNELAQLHGLAASGLVSRQQLDTAAVAVVTTSADADAARARVGGAEGALRHARTTIGQEAVQRETLGVGQATLQRAEALLALAKLRLTTADLTAPAGGLVVRRLAEPGEAVGAGQAVLAIANPARIWVTAQVAESEATRVHEGSVALMRFDALPGKRFAGRVAFVAAATAEASGRAPTPAPNTLRLPSQVPVRIVLDAPDPALRPGLTASVRLEAGR